MTGRFQDSRGLGAATVAFLVGAALLAVVVHVDRRPAPILPDQFTHGAAPAIFVTHLLPIELTLVPRERPSALRIPIWIGEGRRPVVVRVAVGAPGGRAPVETTVHETGLASVPVPDGGAANAPLHVRITSDATSRDTAPRVLWSRDPPRQPLSVRYAGRPVEQVEVLPDTAPLVLLEYPWPTRALLGLWLIVLGGVVAVWRTGHNGVVWLAVALALAAVASSGLLWQRDYTRRAAHIDADQYAESAERMARWVREPTERPLIGEWFRHHPHATTELVPLLLTPLVLAGVPVALAYAFLSALACWLALLVVQRVSTRCLDVPPGIAWLVTLSFACHPLMLRTFARPVTDGVGLLLVVCTLWLLLRRMRSPGRYDGFWLAVLVFAHPLARPQGFGYWPFIAAALVCTDRIRTGAWPSLGATLVAGLRVFAVPLLSLAVLYVAFDWWHNLGLMFEKAARFRLESTAGDFAAGCVGVLLWLPALGLLGRRADAPPLRADPRAGLLLAWGLYATVLLVAVRAPFWLRHFLPVLPVVYWLAAMWLADLRGRNRAIGAGLLIATAFTGVAVTVWQVVHLEPLPGWLAPFVTVP